MDFLFDKINTVNDGISVLCSCTGCNGCQGTCTGCAGCQGAK